MDVHCDNFWIWKSLIKHAKSGWTSFRLASIIFGHCEWFDTSSGLRWHFKKFSFRGHFKASQKISHWCFWSVCIISSSTLSIKRSLRSLKNEAQNRIGMFWQNSTWWIEILCQKSLENYTKRSCCRLYHRIAVLYATSWPPIFAKVAEVTSFPSTNSNSTASRGWSPSCILLFMLTWNFAIAVISRTLPNLMTLFVKLMPWWCRKGGRSPSHALNSFVTGSQIKDQDVILHPFASTSWHCFPLSLLDLLQAHVARPFVLLSQIVFTMNASNWIFLSLFRWNIEKK